MNWININSEEKPLDGELVDIVSTEGDRVPDLYHDKDKKEFYSYDDLGFRRYGYEHITHWCRVVLPIEEININGTGEDFPYTR